MTKWKKRLIWLAAIVLLVVVPGAYFNSKPKPDDKVVSGKVVTSKLKQTVKATGQAVSETDLKLTFKGSGMVASVPVRVGTKVSAGQILASLDQKDQLASLTSARGSLASAQANLSKVLSGTSNEEVRVAQSAVDSAEVTLSNARKNYDSTVRSQDVIVNNARVSLLNSGLSLSSGSGNLSTVQPVVTGSYNSTVEGQYKISVYRSGSGLRFKLTGLENSDGEVLTSPVALGSRGLFITFPSQNLFPDVDSWTLDIPNTQSAQYTTNLNNYRSALESKQAALLNAQNAITTAESGVAQARANLASRQSAARPADVAAANAQILSAQGQVALASANLENTYLRAPASGVITEVNVKLGELASPSKQAFVLQDLGQLHLEANISEANISRVKQGQKVEVTFDAFSESRKFMATVVSIDPASTVIGGVVNYKVTATLDQTDEVKPGMTANLTILVDERPEVTAVPSSAVVSKDGKKFVRIITDPVLKKYNEIPVELGLEADGGLIEVISGLKSGDEVVTLIKSK